VGREEGPFDEDGTLSETRPGWRLFARSPDLHDRAARRDRTQRPPVVSDDERRVVNVQPSRSARRTDSTEVTGLVRDPPRHAIGPESAPTAPLTIARGPNHRIALPLVSVQHQDPTPAQPAGDAPKERHRGRPAKVASTLDQPESIPLELSDRRATLEQRRRPARALHGDPDRRPIHPQGRDHAKPTFGAADQEKLPAAVGEHGRL